MSDPFGIERRRRPRRIRKASPLLEVDAWVDSTAFTVWNRFSQFWEGLVIASRRMRSTGWRRGLSELASEGFTLGVVGAMLMLLLALPAFKETEGDWRKLDDYAVTFLDRYGNVIGQRGIIQRDSVPVDQLPDHVIKAVLATEDRRFFEHYGIDFVGLVRAMNENVRANSVVQGGSTLTQQLAKNLFLTNERTIERKIKEAFLAVWLEYNMTKKEILQLYLDRAYMGGGTFGIAAAADFYFGKDVKDVTMAEAAMLAGLFKAPARYAPHINLPAARARANEVLTNLVQGGFMSEGQVIAARRNPATAIDRDSSETPDYYLDWAFDEVKKLAENAPTRTLIAKTSFDPALQKAVEESIEYHLRQYGKDYRVGQAAAVLIDNDGGVRAIVGGRDYGVSQFNRATRALRQSGSSFKTYVYTTAMEKGLTPETVVADAPITWGRWSPHNYSGGYSGRVTLTTALVKSINTVPVRLARDYTGIESIRQTAYAMGVESEIETFAPMVLGTSGMTVMDQATGYLTLANDGYVGKRHGVTQLLSQSGDVLYDFYRDAPAPHRVVSQQAVKSMNTILAQVPEWGTGRRAKLDGMRNAGKTGTTQAYRDAWFCGFTGNFTAAVWYGNDDFTPTNRLTGGSLPAMTWKRFMTYAHQNVRLKPIPELDDPGIDEAARPAIASAEGEGEDALPDIVRPRSLSLETLDVLRTLNRRLTASPEIAAPPDPTTVSALQDNKLLAD
ncbi:MAG: PBP1A family penicillin-binding protein [Brucellaceae bacterium]|nr:PBP1A family penicillin-binding protein [Brucellaceae bacterium]